MQFAVNLTIDLDEALGSDAAHNLQPFSNHRSSLLRSKHVYLPITRTVSLARFESQFSYCDSVEGLTKKNPAGAMTMELHMNKADASAIEETPVGLVAHSCAKDRELHRSSSAARWPGLGRSKRSATIGRASALTGVVQFTRRKAWLRTKF